jgi:hypothetical protein
MSFNVTRSTLPCPSLPPLETITVTNDEINTLFNLPMTTPCSIVAGNTLQLQCPSASFRVVFFDDSATVQNVLSLSADPAVPSRFDTVTNGVIDTTAGVDLGDLSAWVCPKGGDPGVGRLMMRFQQAAPRTFVVAFRTTLPPCGAIRGMCLGQQNHSSWATAKTLCVLQSQVTQLAFLPMPDAAPLQLHKVCVQSVFDTLTVRGVLSLPPPVANGQQAGSDGAAAFLRIGDWTVHQDPKSGWLDFSHEGGAVLQALTFPDQDINFCGSNRGCLN